MNSKRIYIKAGVFITFLLLPLSFVKIVADMGKTAVMDGILAIIILFIAGFILALLYNKIFKRIYNVVKPKKTEIVENLGLILLILFNIILFVRGFISNDYITEYLMQCGTTGILTGFYFVQCKKGKDLK
ncbi:hypothetical protein [Lachnoclostridium sp. An76]|uniref:hypothetical protein n=1 Tax=Lachnoclostridium sp. An76 TaxID=1965654 RepID=UPI000B375DC2|nr:hypothetical protein [Lachnoclostridium sp. An76]OUN35313.1 hypothetical protein B5G27_06760 [Lachnoclostridium sp. An76]